MTIPHFADQQNLVFVPALVALLVATLLICLPIVFAPGVRRMGRGRARALVAAAAVLAAGALVVAGFQAGAGFRTLQEERTSTAAQLQERYRLGLDAGTVNELVDGGSPRVALPALASGLALGATKGGLHALKLRELSSGAFDLTYGGKRVPTA